MRRATRPRSRDRTCGLVRPVLATKAWRSRAPAADGQEPQHQTHPRAHRHRTARLRQASSENEDGDGERGSDPRSREENTGWETRRAGGVGADGPFPRRRERRRKTAPLAGLRGEECRETKSLAATQTRRWECCYHGNHAIPPAPSPEGGQSRSTDGETKAQRGPLSRSPGGEPEGEAGTLSPAPSGPPSPAPAPRHLHILTERPGSTQAAAGDGPGPGSE